MVSIIFIILAFLSTFFMVGLVFVELFFPKIIFRINLPFRIKFPVYIICSVVLSTFLVYLLSLLFGLNRQTVICALLPFLLIAPYKIYKLRDDFLHYFKGNIKPILLALSVITIYFIVLNPAILGKRDGYLVMSGVNWQDTALHMSITQSLTQGNFPPSAPYFSGHPLGYYYFTDLHSAIINLFSGIYFPKIFVIDNAIFAGVLTLSIYSLAYEITKNKKLSIISSVIGSFYGSFIFIKFIEHIALGEKSLELLTNNIYSMEYKEIFGMANMADYFLQNRPMMVGLPVVVIIILLTQYAYTRGKTNILLLVGIITATLIKFQFFCIVACGISVVILSTVLVRKNKIKSLLISYLLFVVPIVVFYLIFGSKDVSGVPFFDLIRSSFRFGVWDSSKSVSWHLKFIFINLGLPFAFTLLAFGKTSKKILRMTILSLIFTLIPYVASFTIDSSDMLKFFYFSVVIFSVVAPYVVSNIIKNRPIANLVLFIVIITTSLSSILTLANSYLNKNFGYSISDYEAGIWIRNNTPLKSVFVTTTSVHSAPTDLGGRLRVISYTNWPYTHGFNTGTDNVFSRQEDVEKFFKTGDVTQIKLKYNVDYVFYGGTEKSEYPESKILLDNNKKLLRIYSKDDIDIYKLN